MKKIALLFAFIAFPPLAFSQNAAYNASPNAELEQQQLRLEEQQLDMERRLRLLEDKVLKQGDRPERIHTDGNPANRVGPLDIEVIKQDKHPGSVPIPVAPYPMYR